jgi:hypothetical protein
MRAALRHFGVRLEYDRLLGAVAERDHVARLHEERRDVDDPAVHAEVAVRHELARLRPAHGHVHPVDHVVEPALEQLQERLARLARHARGAAEVVLELRFEHAVVAAHLLLLAQLAAVLGDLLTRLGVLRLLTRGGTAALDGALARQAAVAFDQPRFRRQRPRPDEDPSVCNRLSLERGALGPVSTPSNKKNNDGDTFLLFSLH